MNSIKECPIVHHQQVAWGDMDAFGHVNNVMYYRYIESARIEYLTQVEAFSHGLISVVSSSSCRFYRPVFFPDLLKIGVRVVELRNSGFRMSYVLYSNHQGQMVATGEAIVVMVNAETNEKAALPIELRQKIAKLEASVGHDLQLNEHQEKNRLSEIGRALRENLDQIVPKIGK